MSGCKNKGPHPDESVVKKEKEEKVITFWGRGRGQGTFMIAFCFDHCQNASCCEVV